VIFSPGRGAFPSTESPHGDARRPRVPRRALHRVALVVADNPAGCEAIARAVSVDLKAKKMRLEDTQCVRVEQS
jgi:hypothetical protein